MKELKEITIGSDNLNLQDNLVKSSILPQVNKELARNIMVQGNVIIEGALFANNLEIINGPAEFKGAVYTHQDFHLNSDARGDIQFDKAVGCASAIVCLAPAAKIYFGADVNGKTVKLKMPLLLVALLLKKSSLNTVWLLVELLLLKPDSDWLYSWYL